MLFIALDVNLAHKFTWEKPNNGFLLANTNTNMQSKTTPKQNGIAQHIMETNHEIDWENRKFLDSESHWRRRKIKEALFIDCLNPQKEVTDSIMNLEKGLEISECWKEFNQDIRKVLFKIIPIKK